jgi:lambda family phage portal protein
MNRFEKFISFLSPSLALGRAKSFFALEQIRKYDAGSHSKRTQGWQANGGSSNVEILGALSTLRNRSRELVRNNPYAKKAIQIISNNVIGMGIRPKLTNAKKRDQVNILKAWKSWAETTECDFEGNLNFYGLQALIMKAVAESGDVIIRQRRVSTNGKDNQKNIIPIKLQVCEGDFLDHTKNLGGSSNEPYVIQGVQFDATGKKIGYWLFDRHPFDVLANGMVSTLVPISEVIHIFSVERPGQVRGVPFLSASAMKLRDFDDYEDAQLMRQKIAACFSVFITDSSENLVGGIKNTKKDSKGNLSERVQPGIIEHLPAGKTVSFASPPGTTGYAEYSKTQLRGIAAGVGITYEALTGDLSNVNFSSGRMGWLEFHRQVQAWQNNLIIPQCCDRAWKWFLDGCNIQGITSTEVIPVSWISPRREMIDPVKEIKGMTDEIRAGLCSWGDQVAELGYDPEELLIELTNEARKFKEAELMLASDPRYDATRTNDPMTPPPPPGTVAQAPPGKSLKKQVKKQVKKQAKKQAVTK